MDVGADALSVWDGDDDSGGDGDGEDGDGAAAAAAAGGAVANGSEADGVMANRVGDSRALVFGKRLLRRIRRAIRAKEQSLARHLLLPLTRTARV